ncbi:MAG TPA: TRAM domain-containing protein [Nitrososphaerales archaeon]|nr:TRAM domain-containing protein [Nitrososphaerales archaeon]
MSFGQRGGYGSRGGYRGRSGSFNKPVEVGKEYNVSISEVSRRGDGLTRIEGFVVFVPGTQRGQNVRIKITQVSDRFATGQVVQTPDTPRASTSESSGKTGN